MADTQERVLVWDRIESNRRTTLFLLAVFALLSLPPAVYMAQYIGFVASVLIVVPVFGEDWLAALVIGVVVGVGAVATAAYLQYRYASSTVLRFSGAREVERDEEPELARTVENLCIGAGLPQPRLYVIESAAANAFATGLSPQSSALVVTRGLLALLDRRELEGVIAHELVQIGNHDTRLSTVLAAGVAMLRLPLAIVVAIFRFLFRIHWALGGGLLLYLGLPLLASVPFAIAVAGDFLQEDLLIGVIFISSVLLPFYVFLVAPFLAYVIRRLVLRQREFLADADAVLLSRYSEGLARALAKMGAARGARMRVAGATAHLYVVDPLPADAPPWDRLFSTHPPVEERIALLAGMGGGIAPSVLWAAEEAGAKFGADDAAIVTARPQGRATADEGTLSAEPAPPAKPSRGPAAFRLTGPSTTLYEKPDAASTPLARLEGGALITILETDGDFVRVLTTDDSFGYIANSVPMTEVDLDGPAAA